jgi:hypothetical protein
MPRIATPSSLARVAIAAVVLATVPACAAGTSAAAPVPPTGAATPAAASGGASGGAADCPGGAWRSVPASVTRHVAAPAMPVVTAIRTAAHPGCGYDRLVLDITGPLPSVQVRSVSQVTADPSGEPITLPGQRYLLITLQPAQAHDSSGRSTLPRSVRTLGYPALKSYAVAGDFEGVFTVALGLGGGPLSIRIGELPGHWYIDIKT